MAKQTFTTGQVLTAAQMTDLQQTAMGGGSATAKTASYVLVAADAGTSVLMNSASATTITVNTALFAAGDTVYIQNIGAGISTITAGTATVTTSASLALAQWEGGNLYFTSTSAAIFIKGAGAAAASGGMTLLSTTTLSGVSTTISSIDQTYKNLQIEIEGVTNASVSFRMFARPNATNNLICDNAMFLGVTSFGNVENIYYYNVPYGTNIKQTGGLNAFVLLINNYASTTNYKPFNSYGSFQDVSDNNVPIFQNGDIVTTSAISSIAFYTTGYGTFNGGTVRIYGVK
jgi:hypothetical protein